MEDKEKNEIRALLKVLEEKLQKPENSWLFEELRRMINNVDISDIREVLNIKGLRSIDYSFLKKDNEKRLREQLEIDNIRMENAAVTTRITDEVERFYTFSINALYQIENLINYYYYELFSSEKGFNSRDFVKYLKKNNPILQKDENQYLLDKITNVSDVALAYKLFALNGNILNSYEYNRLNDLRDLRNEGLHRCSIIMRNNEINNPIFKFFGSETFNSVRSLLKKIVRMICSDLYSEATIIYVLRSQFSFTVVDSLGTEKNYIYEGSVKEGIEKGDVIYFKGLRVDKKGKVTLLDYRKKQK